VSSLLGEPVRDAGDKGGVADLGPGRCGVNEGGGKAVESKASSTVKSGALGVSIPMISPVQRKSLRRVPPWPKLLKGVVAAAPADQVSPFRGGEVRI
jgi:hypothetical protein